MGLFEGAILQPSYDGPHRFSVSLATLKKFECSQILSMLAYSFGFLNHPHKELLAAVSKRVCSDRNLFSNSQACHNIAWACMVAELYPKKLLTHLFSSSSFDPGELPQPMETDALQMLSQLPGVSPTTFSDWEKIDRVEQRVGKESGKPREKVVSINRMMEIIRES